MWRGRNLAAAERDVVVELELLRERLVELEARAVEDVRRQDALRLLLQLLQPRRAAPVLPLALPHARSCALSAEAGGAEGGRELVTSGQLRTNTDSRNPVIGLSELGADDAAAGDSVHVWRSVITGHPQRKRVKLSPLEVGQTLPEVENVGIFFDWIFLHKILGSFI